MPAGSVSPNQNPSSNTTPRLTRVWSTMTLSDREAEPAGADDDDEVEDCS